MNAPPTPDRAAILAALQTLFEPTDVIELRAFPKGKKRTAAGYFDGEHRDALADAAVRLNAGGAAVYVTLNRIDPQLLGRYCNRVEEFAADTATDANVTRRRWLLIDFDPVRPKNTAASDAQVATAQERARDCYRVLQADGWPDPLVAESGNGWHLLYPLDLPNDTESRELVKGALEGLAARFDDDAVKADTSVFNAGRITKLYGTVATKGDHTAPAPWRLSRLVKVPLIVEVVSPEQLRALHPLRNEGTNSPPPPGAGQRGAFNLSDFLARLGIRYERDTHEGRDRYRLERCPFNPDHGKGEAAIFQAPSGALGFKCQHAGCADKHWADVRALVDGARSRTKARAADDFAASAETDGGAVVVRVADVKPEPIAWLWAGRIALGKVSLISGDPGLGKSLVSLALAAHVTHGRPWPVDGSPCPAGDVLLLSAEDDIADTIRPRLEAAGADVARVHVLQMIRDVDKEGAPTVRGVSLKRDLAVLDELLTGRPGVRLVVVDPVSAYLGDVDSHNNADVRGLFAPLAELAARHRVAIVAVSHLNKSAGPAMYRTSGSLAFVAAARAVFAVVKDKNDPARRLMLPVKNNLGPDSTGLAYRVIQAANGAPLVDWEPDPVTETADEAMRPAGVEEERAPLEEAKAFLSGLLEFGPVPVRQIKADADGAGHAWSTIRRAQSAIGVEAIKEGGHFGAGGQRWVWRLPPLKVLNPSEDAQPSRVSAFNDGEHLQHDEAYEEGLL